MSRCLSPIMIKPKNDPESRMKRVLKGQNDIQGPFYVPCGKCYNCLSRRRNEWAFRLHAESLASDTVDTLFITLTRNDVVNDMYDHVVRKDELQNLFKSLRKSGCMFKYYAIGEYGTHTHRAHYHMMVFLKAKDGIVTDRVQFVNNLKYYYQVFDSNKKPIMEKGFIKVDDINPARVNYVLHYHVRPKTPPADVPTVEGVRKTTGELIQVGYPFAICSQGLGLEFISNPNLLTHLEETGDYVIHDEFGRVSSLPNYYRKKFGLKPNCDPVDASVFADLPKKYRHNFNYLFSARDNDKRKLEKYNIQDKL